LLYILLFVTVDVHFVFNYICFLCLDSVDLNCYDKTGTLSVGKEDAAVTLHGPGIVSRHAEIVNNRGDVTLVPRDGAVLHNGKLLQNPVKLHHGDR